MCRVSSCPGARGMCEQSGAGLRAEHVAGGPESGVTMQRSSMCRVLCALCSHAVLNIAQCSAQYLTGCKVSCAPKPCLAPGLLPHVPLSVNAVEPLVPTRRMHAVTQP